MAYTINLDENLIAFAEKSALADNVSLELWCERKLNGNVKRLMKDTAIQSIESARVENLTTYVEAVEAVKADIKAAKEAEIKAEEVVGEEPIVLTNEEEATSTEAII